MVKLVIWRIQARKKKSSHIIHWANLSFQGSIYICIYFGESGSSSLSCFKKVVQKTTPLTPRFLSFLDLFHDFLLGKRSRLKTVAIYVTIEIDALPIKINLCQGLINYVLTWQLTSLQGNCIHSPDQSTYFQASLFVSSLARHSWELIPHSVQQTFLEYHKVPVSKLGTED